MSKECVCGLIGSETIAEAKQVINHKRESKGERYWTYVKCPMSELYHAFNGERFTEDQYVADILNGKHKERLELSRLREQSTVSVSTYLQPELLAAPLATHTRPVVVDLKPDQEELPLPPPSSPAPTCIKMAYANEATAKQVLAICKSKGRNEKNVYLCHECHSWHLTSQDQKTTRSVHFCKFDRDDGSALILERVYTSTNGEPEVFTGVGVTMQHPNPAMKNGFSYSRNIVKPHEFSQFLEGVMLATLDEQPE